VLAYRALPGEPDVSALAQSFELFTTRARWKPQPHLTLHAWDTATELSRFGVLQPPASAPRVVLNSVDAVLLPALAFDEQGVRLGYGGGFYDRLLPGFAGLTVGVIWSDLIVPRLPSEAHDVRAGWLATEAGVCAVGLEGEPPRCWRNAPP
jgi:5-formyltetrahydrofolate cyclo-ligase